MTTRTLTIVLTLCALTLTASAARADGCFLMAPEYYLNENNQIAFLRHEDGRQQLSILPRFHGDAVDFAWIVPVPALPQLQADDVDLFHQAEDMTRPIHRDRDGWDCFEDTDYVGDAGTPNVQVVAEETIGIYRTMTIAAADAQALVDSLTAWGYLDATNTGEITPVLEDYVQREWFFVTMKVDEEQLIDEYPWIDGHWWGEMQPVRLSFDTPEMVYPLRISALSADDTSEVILYTVAAHRMMYPLATTLYANRISASEMQGIRQYYPQVADWVTEGDFLTKLSRVYSPSEMSGDLVLERADSDAEFRAVRYSGVPWIGAVFAVSALGWCGTRFVRRSRGKNIPKRFEGMP